MYCMYLNLVTWLLDVTVRRRQSRINSVALAVSDAVTAIQKTTAFIEEMNALMLDYAV